MKSFIFIPFLLLVCSISNAQKEFEGMIRYKASPEKDIYIRNMAENKDSMEINIWFTKGKILIRNISKDPAEDILVLIDSAKVYTIDRNNETFSVKKLRVSKLNAPAEVLHIAGYRSSPVQSSARGNAFGGSVNTTIWYADSLLFTVPEKFENNEELLMVRNGHIMLKAEISTDFVPENYTETDDETNTEEVDNKITLIASAVIQGDIKPEDFIIPANFKKYSPAIDSSAVWDSSVMVDTAFVPVAPPAPKKAPASPKKPASKAVKSTKQPIRKEN